MTDLTSLGYKVQNLDEVRDFAPAAFSEGYDPKRSNKYSFVSTAEILRNMEQFNWFPTYARQNGSSRFARHIVRLHNPNFQYINIGRDNIRPQLSLDNSHDGTSRAQIHMGLFRLVCANGLVIGIPGLHSNLTFRHMGVDRNELKNVLGSITEQYNTVIPHIEDMMNVELNRDQKEEFAIKAIAHREKHVFFNEDGTINTKKVTDTTDVKEILMPLRGEDERNDLWTVFNVLQEKMIKGGFNRKNDNNRNVRIKGLTSASRNINYNKAIWDIAESYMPGHSSDIQVGGKYAYTTKKGDRSNVEVLEMEGDTMKVKDIAANRVFAINKTALMN